MRHVNQAFIIALLAVASILMTTSARATVVWRETVNGDLSGNGNAPTDLGVWGPGTYAVIASSSSGDIDDFTFGIAVGNTLQSLTNSEYAGNDGTAFIGIASGSTVDHAGAPDSLLGYTHFGPNPGNTDIDLLPSMTGGPLGFGKYTVWWQQLSADATTAQFDFVVVPEPGSCTIVALVAVACATTRTRRFAQPR